ncbi:MAG: hypothetical protein J7K21_00880 [Desulfurococcales archaeon]|nr:hypothetical protein [Desulfurococcales archaeon]
MSQMPRLIAGEEIVKQFMYVTINGRLIPRNDEDYMKLCLLAYRFKAGSQAWSRPRTKEGSTERGI